MLEWSPKSLALRLALDASGHWVNSRSGSEAPDAAGIRWGSQPLRHAWGQRYRGWPRPGGWATAGPRRFPKTRILGVDLGVRSLVWAGAHCSWKARFAERHHECSVWHPGKNSWKPEGFWPKIPSRSVLFGVTKLVFEFSPVEYTTDSKSSRLKRLPQTCPVWKRTKSKPGPRNTTKLAAHLRRCRAPRRDRLLSIPLVQVVVDGESDATLGSSTDEVSEPWPSEGAVTRQLDLDGVWLLK